MSYLGEGLSDELAVFVAEHLAIGAIQFLECTIRVDLRNPDSRLIKRRPVTIISLPERSVDT